MKIIIEANWRTHILILMVIFITTSAILIAQQKGMKLISDGTE